MTVLQSIVLGIIQGLTEFLPISSSAHLVIAPYLFGWDIPAQDEFIFDVLVQLGTLVAVFTYFRQELLEISRSITRGVIRRQLFTEPSSRLGWFLILATIPAAMIGVLLDDFVEQAFDSPVITAFFLLGTATLLFIAERLGKQQRQMSGLNWKDALWIGLFQALALFPGISRSGATITGGMVRNLDRTTAARFSFLMSIPVMLAAGLIALLDLIKIPSFISLITPLITGFMTSAVVGYFSIRWLLTYLTSRPLNAFAIYCVAISSLVLLMYLFGH